MATCNICLKIKRGLKCSDCEFKSCEPCIIKTDDDIRRESKLLESYIHKLENNPEQTRIEEFIFQTNDEVYYEVFEKTDPILNKCKIYNSYNVTRKNPDKHFIFDVKFLFKEEIDENKILLEITSSINCNLSVFGEINKNIINENIFVYSLENGCIPLPVNTVQVIFNFRPYPCFISYKMCQITNPDKREKIIRGTCYFNDLICKYGYFRYTWAYRDKSECNYEDGERCHGQIISPTNTFYDILMNVVQSQINAEHGYAINPLKKLVIFYEQETVLCYVYDKATGLYMDEEYLKEKHLKIKQLGLIDDLNTMISKYF